MPLSPSFLVPAAFSTAGFFSRTLGCLKKYSVSTVRRPRAKRCTTELAALGAYGDGKLDADLAQDILETRCFESMALVVCAYYRSLSALLRAAECWVWLQ